MEMHRGETAELYMMRALDKITGEKVCIQKTKLDMMGEWPNFNWD